MATRPIDDIIQWVKLYAETELRAAAPMIDKLGAFPDEPFRHLADLGVLRIPFTREHGGLGGTLQDMFAVIRFVSRECASTGSIVLTQASFGITPIFHYGTDEQKRRYLPALLSGEMLGAFAMNEEDSGSDMTKMETVAVERDDHWELTGSKHYISNAGKAGIYSVAAKTISLTGEESYGIFLIEPEMSGVTIGPLEEKMGIKGMPVAGLTFEQVRVPKTAVLGGQPGGTEQCRAIKNYNKLFVAAQGIGIAEGVFERTMTYMQQDRRFGQRLIDLPNNQMKLADAYTGVFAASALLESVENFYKNEERRYAMIKLQASTVAVETAEMAIQLTGGYGYMRENDIERYVRDARLTQIYGGGNQTQRMIISLPWVARSEEERGLSNEY